jgi:hypothetical protein
LSNRIRIENFNHTTILIIPTLTIWLVAVYFYINRSAVVRIRYMDS